MANLTALETEEYIEQTYFFRAFRERLGQNVPTQEILARVRDEILSTTRLPLAIDFLCTELKHAGLLGPAMERLSHYFTRYQAFVMSQAEEQGAKIPIELALAILEREAEYKSCSPTRQGLFVYQFEALCRNRLGYDAGMQRIANDPLYDDAWRDWIRKLRFQLGTVDFADLLYARSEFARLEQRRSDPAYQPKHPVLFGEREGKIAKANHGKDPLYLFAALQRQLGYPEVPRPKPPDATANLLHTLDRKLQQLEMRLKLLEGEIKGDLDISQFYVKPDKPG
jgi:hypothetical protein